jgi:hypothetical protein
LYAAANRTNAAAKDGAYKHLFWDVFERAALWVVDTLRNQVLHRPLKAFLQAFFSGVLQNFLDKRCCACFPDWLQETQDWQDFSCAC